LKRTTTDEQAFLEQAERELAALMAEVSQSDLRHGPKPRTIEQTRALLTAKLDALHLECEELAAQLEGLQEQEEREAEEPTRDPRKGPPTGDPDAEARWLKGARRELAELIREIEGPRPQPAPRGRS
jgi:hypothetical protein